MKVLIATPAYGGQVTTSYFQSVLRSADALRAAGIDFHVMTLSQESLIPRGRNICAKQAIVGGYDRLMFIDADLSWEPEDLLRVLRSDKRVVAGTYPVKTFPITLNLNPTEETAKDFPASDRGQDSYFNFIRKHADENGEVEVFHVPTGFMNIEVKLLVELAESGAVEKYMAFDAARQQREVYFSFFPSGATDGRYVSEDWAFCEIVRQQGIPVYLQSQSICAHVGTFAYGLGSHIIIGQKPLIPKGEKRCE